MTADLKLKHWSADRHSSMTLEAAFDHIKNDFSDGHLEGVIVSCTLNFINETSAVTVTMIIDRRYLATC